MFFCFQKILKKKKATIPDIAMIILTTQIMPAFTPQICYGINHR